MTLWAKPFNPKQKNKKVKKKNRQTPLFIIIFHYNAGYIIIWYKILETTKFLFLKFIFCYQRECPETLSTKESVHGIVLQKFLMECEYFNFCCILHLLMMRWMNRCNYLKKKKIPDKNIHSHSEFCWLEWIQWLQYHHWLRIKLPTRGNYSSHLIWSHKSLRYRHHVWSLTQNVCVT